MKVADQPEESDQDQSNLAEVTLSEFFESKPANVTFRIIGNEDFDLTVQLGGGSLSLKLPPIHLWCHAPKCGNIRVCEPMTRDLEIPKHTNRTECVYFECSDCRQVAKIFAIWCYYHHHHETGRLEIRKLGEDPPLSPRLPPRLRKLIGTDQEKFSKGLKSEMHGLGVGAFAYYRQVVENQKNRLLDEFIKVENLSNARPALISELEEARRETRFSSAVDKIKHAIPEVLRIKGHNPLTLLHKALSEGLHAGTDEDCLEIAEDIRVILSELSERLHAALKDDAELKKAVSRIQNRPKKVQKPPE
jgi:hypothetical protein